MTRRVKTFVFERAINQQWGQRSLQRQAAKGEPMKTTNLIHSGLFRMTTRGGMTKFVQPQLHDGRHTVVWGRLTWSRLRLDDALRIDGRRRKILYRSHEVPLLFH